MSLILKVVTYKGSPPEREISASFDGQGGTVGRSPGNRLVLPDPERCISRTHAEIKCQDGQFVYIDASSAGTYLVDRDRVLMRESVLLQDGNRLRIGDYELSVSIPIATEAPPAADFFSAEIFQAEAAPVSAQPAGESPARRDTPGFDPFPGLSDEPSRSNEAGFFDTSAPPSGPLGQSQDERLFAREAEGFDPFFFPAEPEAAKPLGGPSFLTQPDAPAFQDSFSLPDIQTSEPAASSAKDDFANFSLEDFFADNDPMRSPSGARAGGDDDFDLLSHLSPEDIGAAPSAPDARADAAEPFADLSPFPDFPESEPSQPATSMPFEPLFPAVPAASEYVAPQEAKTEPPVAAKSEPAVAIPKPRGHASGPKLSQDTLPRHPAYSPEPPSSATRVAPAADFARPESPQGASGDRPQPPALDGAALYRAFLDGAGLGPEHGKTLSQEELNATMKRAGALFREMVEGMMISLRGRSEAKNEFRVGVTVLRPKNNNPLKFSVIPEDAMKIMLAREHPGYIDPLEAVKEAFGDLMYHQIAMNAGIQASLNDLLQRFDPQSFEKQYGEGIIFGKKNKCWEAYCQAYPKLVNDAQEDIFGERFAEVYEQQIRKLRPKPER